MPGVPLSQSSSQKPGALVTSLLCTSALLPVTKVQEERQKKATGVSSASIRVSGVCRLQVPQPTKGQGRGEENSSLLPFSPTAHSRRLLLQHSVCTWGPSLAFRYAQTRLGILEEKPRWCSGTSNSGLVPSPPVTIDLSESSNTGLQVAVLPLQPRSVGDRVWSVLIPSSRNQNLTPMHFKTCL